MKVVQVSACLLILHCVFCVAENEQRTTKLSDLLIRVLEAVKEDERVERYGDGGRPGMGSGGHESGMSSGGHESGMGSGGHKSGMGSGGHESGIGSGGHKPGMSGGEPSMGGHRPGMGGHRPGMGGHHRGNYTGGNYTGAAGNRTMHLPGSSSLGRARNRTQTATATFLRSLEGCGSSSASSEEDLGGLGDFLTEATDLCTKNAAAINDQLLDDFCTQAQGAKTMLDSLTDADKKSPCTYSDCDAPTPEEINTCIENTIKTVAGVIEVAGGATGPIKVVLLEGVRAQLEELYDYFEDMVKENAPAPTPAAAGVL